MKKSVLKAFFLLAAFAVLFSVSVFSADAAVKKSYLTADEAAQWLDSTVGEKRGDGHCIAFIKDYYQILTGYIPSGNACEYAHNTLPEGFGWKRIKGERNLKKGDILIWTGGTGGMGHAAIYGGDVKYYHQKWSGMYVEIIGKAYLDGFPIRRSGSFARYWGVIRPNFRSESMFEKMPDENYRLTNSYSGKVLTAGKMSEIYVDSLVSPESKRQVFTFDKSETGYEISPLSSVKTVGAAFTDSKTRSGVSVNLYGGRTDDSRRWRFQKKGSYYIIRNVFNPSLCLTADKKSGKLTVKTYQGASNQKWTLTTDIVLTYKATGGWNAPFKTKADMNGECKISSEIPFRLGCKFIGWAKKKNAGQPDYLPGETVKLKENTTLYAVWERNKEYETEKVKLSKRKYTYNGKVKTPSVTVTDTNGNILREGKDYTLSYSKGRKNPGRYKVTVSYKEKFSGKDTLFFTILPRSTKITSLVSDDEKITVKFKRQAQKTTGYAIQYSTNSDFSAEETVTLLMDGVRKTAKAIRNLAPDTKWYVRVRTFTEKDDTTYYSDWSDAKSIRTTQK
ncbi:MAG: InlB B-repeat-containing protein [Clostridia bacterium]|nr:InlB B-repeat-containing protein [Clostridia bacterium]